MSPTAPDAAPAPAPDAAVAPARALPTLAEVLAGAHVVRLPLRTRFRGVTEREALLVEGPRGWTEFSPFVEYGPEEAATWLTATLDFGWGAEPQLRTDRVEVNATLPAVAAGDVPAVLEGYRGCRTVKVKVAEPGGSLDADVARVAAARRWVGNDGAVRVDANGAWTVDEALGAAAALAPFDLQYLEQPCATVPELAELRRRLDGSVLVAADESVRRAEDPLAVARAGAADLLVIKAQPLGGVAAALRVVRAAGLPIVVSSAIDTSVGLSMGAHLAAAAPGVAYACGLGTAALLAADVTAEPLSPVDGSVPVRRIEVDGDLLRRYAADPARRSWWLERVRSCWDAAVDRSTAGGDQSPE